MGKLKEAWDLHEVAKSAARESGVAAGLTYACAQQAYVLLDAGRPAEALELIRSTREQAWAGTPQVLRVWLHAAEGEALAILGLRDASLRALDCASAALPSTGGVDDLPYVMLDADHLARWRGHCLARLGEPSAIDDLTSALSAMGEGSFGHAEAGLRVDLALAFQARGDTTQARAQARRAGEVAGRSGSRRQRLRIAELLSA